MCNSLQYTFRAIASRSVREWPWIFWQCPRLRIHAQTDTVIRRCWTSMKNKSHLANLAKAKDTVQGKNDFSQWARAFFTDRSCWALNPIQRISLSLDCSWQIFQNWCSQSSIVLWLGPNYPGPTRPNLFPIQVPWAYYCLIMALDLQLKLHNIGPNHGPYNEFYMCHIILKQKV